MYKRTIEEAYMYKPYHVNILINPVFKRQKKMITQQHVSIEKFYFLRDHGNCSTTDYCTPTPLYAASVCIENTRSSRTEAMSG